MITIEQFIKDNGLTVDWQPTFENPNMSDMPKGSTHFKATIKTGGAEVQLCRLSTYYSCGPGIIENWARETKFKTFVSSELINSPDKVMNAPGMLAGYLKQAKLKFRPDLADLLDCLASDASMIENARSFADWAEDLGYDSDSIKARKTYDICVEQRRDLEHLLGREQMEVLMWDIERL